MPVVRWRCAVLKGHGEQGLSVFSGGHGEGETPLPIPNRAVKPLSADGTWPSRAWESRTPPVSSLPGQRPGCRIRTRGRELRRATIRGRGASGGRARGRRGPDRARTAVASDPRAPAMWVGPGWRGGRPERDVRRLEKILCDDPHALSQVGRQEHTFVTLRSPPDAPERGALPRAGQPT
jgi:hypothetical protein